MSCCHMRDTNTRSERVKIGILLGSSRSICPCNAFRQCTTSPGGSRMADEANIARLQELPHLHFQSQCVARQLCGQPLTLLHTKWK
eukprot:6292411-Amphidinium_carterae.1